jgi:hypothetical protein
MNAKPWDYLQLNYDPKTRTFSQEASALGIGVPANEVYVRGTQRTVKFVYQGADRTEEGEITAWHFTAPVNQCKLIIFND